MGNSDQLAVFSFYNDVVKPLYCEIEASGNTLPVELLFEIHAAFDHLKRFHTDGHEESKCCEKAISHLKRGALDALKIKLRDFNRDTDKLLKSGIDLSLINNGGFLYNLASDRTAITKLATCARKSEGVNDKEKAFEAWYEASLKIDEFRDKYLDSPDIVWAKAKTFSYINKDSIRGFLIGILTGFLSSLLFSLFNRSR